MGIKVGDRNILGYYVGDLPAEQYVGDEKARPDVPTNRLAYYPFNDTYGINDATGQFPLTPSENVDIIDDGNVNCVTFINGVGGLYTSTNFPITGEPVFTFSAWVKQTDTGQMRSFGLFAFGQPPVEEYGVVVEGGNWACGLFAEGGFYKIGCWSNDRQTSLAIKYDERVNIVATYNQDTVTIYEDGVLIGTYTGFNYDVQSGQLCIGTDLVNYAVRTPGNMSEVIMDGYVWTAQEVADYYNSTYQYYKGGRAGIYWNKARGLLTVSDDGQNWITLSDKNQGALYDYFDGCQQTEDYYGSYFQRGNDYPFPWDGNIPVYHSQVDTTGYDWSNPYNSGEFRYPGAGGSSRPNYSNPGNESLRGADSGLVSHKQGPCDSGFHVPTELEFNDLISMMETLLGGDYTEENFLYYLKLPCAGVRFGDADYSYPSHNNVGNYWLSDCMGANPTNASLLMVGRGSPLIIQSGRPVSGNSVRPFYNSGVAPEGGDWQVLYQPN